MPHTQSKKRSLKLLLIEDDEADILLIQQQLLVAQQRANLEVALHVARDAAAATALLAAQAMTTQPIDLILLDEGLPQQSGLEWLQHFKASADLPSRTPVVMLTNRQEQEFVDRAYQMHVSAYLVKPATPAEFAQMIEALLVFWSQIAQLPPPPLPPKPTQAL